MFANKITFFLMGHKGYETLKYMVAHNYKKAIDMVVVSRDLSIQEDYYQQIVNECYKNNIPYLDKDSVNKISTPYSIAISWRWIIKKKETQKLITLHDSILPKLRGFNPLVTALMNKHTQIGVTAIYSNEKFDTGPIIDVESISINYPIKIKKAIELITFCYIKIVDRIIQKILLGEELPSVEQEEQKATYSLWRDNDDYIVDWNQSAEQIARFIDAVGYPYNGAIVSCNNQILVIEDSEALDDIIIENRVPGKVIFTERGQPVVVCKKGLLKIKKLVDPKTKKSVLPLEKFRVRFKRITNN